MIQKKALILTSAGDVHSYAVAEALRRKGALALVWHTSDFPSRAEESIAFSKGRRTLIVKGVEIELENPQVASVWRRRPAFFLPEGVLHPADREFAQQECLSFRRSVFALLAPRAFWVNPPQAALHASSKILQQAIAADVGLSVPDTLATNDPTQIKEFLARLKGRTIYKTFCGGTWENDSSVWVPYTTPVTAETLVDDDILRLTPGIFQATVPKDFELRITVMGQTVIAAKILSQSTAAGRLDWRKAYSELKFEPFSLPKEIGHLCIEMLSRLGLVFGCFDFVVTPEGEYVFLEVNEMGQFLFIEHATDLPLLDAFSDFLLAGTKDFQWDGRPSIRYSDIQNLAHEEGQRSLREHIEAKGSSFWEGSPLSTPIDA